jgi:ketosteroid isomerase-like protein
MLIVKTPANRIILFFFTVLIIGSCSNKKESKTPNDLKDEIIKTENDFAANAKSEGISAAFFNYADENAVILRDNDSLIKGRENIRFFYQNPRYKKFDLRWSPDFVDVSEDGTLGYSYGKYFLKITGDTTEYEGVFHTVWKRQADGSWKFVWD